MLTASLRSVLTKNCLTLGASLLTLQLVNASRPVPTFLETRNAIENAERGRPTEPSISSQSESAAGAKPAARSSQPEPPLDNIDPERAELDRLRELPTMELFKEGFNEFCQKVDGKRKWVLAGTSLAFLGGAFAQGHDALNYITDAIQDHLCMNPDSDGTDTMDLILQKPAPGMFGFLMIMFMLLLSVSVCGNNHGAVRSMKYAANIGLGCCAVATVLSMTSFSTVLYGRDEPINAEPIDYTHDMETTRTISEWQNDAATATDLIHVAIGFVSVGLLLILVSFVYTSCTKKAADIDV